MNEQQNTTEDRNSESAQQADQEVRAVKRDKAPIRNLGTVLMAAGSVVLVSAIVWSGYGAVKDQAEAQTAADFYVRLNNRPTAALVVENPNLSSQTSTATPDTLRRETLTVPPTRTPIVTSGWPTPPHKETPAPVSTEVPKPHQAIVSSVTIASMGLVDEHVTPAGVKTEKQEDGSETLVWDIPDNQVGQRFDSANPGEGGNVVLWAHNGRSSKYVFNNIEQIKDGDRVELTDKDGGKFSYEVRNILFVRADESATPDDIVQGIELIGPTNYEKVTLVACWPKVPLTINGETVPKWSRRIVVEAFPVQDKREPGIR